MSVAVNIYNYEYNTSEIDRPIETTNAVNNIVVFVFLRVVFNITMVYIRMSYISSRIQRVLFIT